MNEKSEVHFYDGMIMFPPLTLELLLRREREKEREACAKVCEDYGTHNITVNCAEAIRARSQS